MRKGRCRRRSGRLAPAALLGTCLLVGASAASAEQISALLFREGVLDGMGAGTEIAYAYRRDGRSAPLPPGAAVDPPLDATVTLSVGPENEVQLALTAGEGRQGVGTFPQEVGNPLIMLFLETVLRDMASQSGGSPFYIRNRIKESLLAEVEAEPRRVALPDGREVSGQEVRVLPFAADAARDRMAGFADLAIVAVVSPEVPGWYYSLAAEAPAQRGSDAAGYSSSMVFLSEESE